MNATSRQNFFNYIVDVGTPPIVRTVRELNAVKAQLDATGKIMYIISSTSGRLMHYLSGGRLCSSNVCALKARLVPLERDKAAFIKKASQIGILLIVGQIGVWGPSSTMLSALMLHGILYEQKY